MILLMKTLTTDGHFSVVFVEFVYDVKIDSNEWFV